MGIIATLAGTQIDASATSLGLTIGGSANLALAIVSGINTDMASPLINAVPMSAISGVVNNSVLHNSAWLLKNPTTGTPSLTWTNTGNLSIVVLAVAGFDTTTTPIALQTTPLSNNNPTAQTTGSASGDLSLGWAHNGNASQTSGGGQTSISAIAAPATTSLSVDSIAGGATANFTWIGSGAGGATNLWDAFSLILVAAIQAAQLQSWQQRGAMGVMVAS